MFKRFIIFFTVVLVGLAAFLIGRLSSQNYLGSGDKKQLALVNNSLISRFNRTEEKYVAPKGPAKISQDAAYFPKLTDNGREVYYYLPQTGQIRSAVITANGDLSAGGSLLIADLQAGLEEIVWSPGGKEIIARDGLNYIFYNLSTGAFKKLKQNLLGPVFSKDGRQLAYLYHDVTTGEGAISLADPQLEISKPILNTRAADWQMVWIDSKTLSLAIDNSLFSLDIETGALAKLLENKTNLEVNWSPNGQKLIFSSINLETGNLALSGWDRAQDGEIDLRVQAPASKCVWSANSNNIYCLAGSSLVTVEVAQMEPEPKILFTDPLILKAEVPILSGAEDYLVFRDSQTKKLYRLNLGSSD